MSLANATNAHHDTKIPIGDPALVRVGDQAGVAQGCPLMAYSLVNVAPRSRLLTPERGVSRVESVGQLVCVLSKRVEEVSMAVAEPGHHVVEGSFDVIVVEGQ